MIRYRRLGLLSVLLVVAATMTAAASASAMSLPKVTANDGASVTSQTVVDSRMLDLEISSPALGFSAPVRLILPQDYSAQPTRTWPVLYLLHGCCDAQDYQAWTHYTDIETLMQDKDVLVVMPSDGEAGFYSQWWNFGLSNKPDYETFHMVELEQILQRGYRAGGTQAIAGISIGGYGAIEYAADYPGTFKAAASYSGVLDTELPGVPQVVEGILVREKLDPLALWGDIGVNLLQWNAHNPFNKASSLKNTQLFVSCGDGAVGPLDPPGATPDPIEPFALSTSEAFTMALSLQGTPVTTDYYGSGTHSWPYWQREFLRSWPMLAGALGVPVS